VWLLQKCIRPDQTATRRDNIAQFFTFLTKKDSVFEFLKKYRKIFNILKMALIHAFVLLAFDPTRLIRIKADLSKYAIGGVLSQLNEKGR
jgi:hypothetical protein